MASRGPRRTEYVSQMGIKRKRNLKKSDGHGRVGHSEVKAGVKDVSWSGCAGRTLHTSYHLGLIQGLDDEKAGWTNGRAGG